MQPYGGLVEHVQDTDEAASYLRSEPYPLGFTARERPRGTAQGEVSEPNVDEETEALPDLFDHPLADDPLPSGELHAVEETLRVCNRKLCELVDVVAADGHGQGFWPEPGTPALGTGNVAHELFDLLPPVLRVGLGVAPLQVADDAVEAGHILPAAVVAVAVRDVDTLAVGAEEDEVPVRLWQVAPREVQVNPILLRKRAEYARVVLGLRVRPRHDGPLVHAQILVRHDEHGVYLQSAPQSVAAVAGPVRAVE